MIDVVYLILWPVAWDSSPGKERQELFCYGIITWYGEVPRYPDYRSIKLDCDVIEHVVTVSCRVIFSCAVIGCELSSSALWLAQLMWPCHDRLVSWFRRDSCAVVGWALSPNPLIGSIEVVPWPCSVCWFVQDFNIELTASALLGSLEESCLSFISTAILGAEINTTYGENLAVRRTLRA